MGIDLAERRHCPAFCVTSVESPARDGSVSSMLTLRQWTDELTECLRDLRSCAVMSICRSSTLPKGSCGE